eukprot:scaffold15200_cov28-Tisochrysis_lutea.AAC.1
MMRCATCAGPLSGSPCVARGAVGAAEPTRAHCSASPSTAPFGLESGVALGAARCALPSGRANTHHAS